jgi:hypothetical protein
MAGTIKRFTADAPQISNWDFSLPLAGSALLIPRMGPVILPSECFPNAFLFAGATAETLRANIKSPSGLSSAIV